MASALHRWSVAPLQVYSPGLQTFIPQVVLPARTLAWQRAAESHMMTGALPGFVTLQVVIVLPSSPQVVSPCTSLHWPQMVW